jgi:hypothetical protein
VNPAVRDMLKNAYETGYLEALRGVVAGDLGDVSSLGDLDAAARGASAEYVVRLAADAERAA